MPTSNAQSHHQCTCLMNVMSKQVHSFPVCSGLTTHTSQSFWMMTFRTLSKIPAEPCTGKQIAPESHVPTWLDHLAVLTCASCDPTSIHSVSFCRVLYLATLVVQHARNVTSTGIRQHSVTPFLPQQAGCSAILVGEAIVKQGDIEAGVKALLL